MQELRTKKAVLRPNGLLTKEELEAVLYEMRAVEQAGDSSFQFLDDVLKDVLALDFDNALAEQSSEGNDARKAANLPQSSRPLGANGLSYSALCELICDFLHAAVTHARVVAGSA